MVRARGDAESEGGVSRAHGSGAANVEQKTAALAARKWERTKYSSDRPFDWHRPFVYRSERKVSVVAFDMFPLSDRFEISSISLGGGLVQIGIG